MANVKNENAPWLGGWIIGAGMGAVAFGVAKVLGGFDWTPAIAIGGVIAAVAGAVMGLPWGAGDRAAAAAAAAEADAHPAPAHASPAPAAAVTAPAAAAVTAPAAAAPVAAAGTGPARLSAARGGKADNLKEIEGIGPAMEKLINELGFYHFDQIASWSEADVAIVDGELKGFKGRITRDKWVAQAKIIVTEGLEAFRERAKTNDY